MTQRKKPARRDVRRAIESTESAGVPNSFEHLRALAFAYQPLSVADRAALVSLFLESGCRSIATQQQISSKEAQTYLSRYTDDQLRGLLQARLLLPMLSESGVGH